MGPAASGARIIGYRKRGQPRKAQTLVVNVRIRADVYDAYCRAALKSRQPVRSVLRHVLTLHAPASAGILVAQKTKTRRTSPTL